MAASHPHLVPTILLKHSDQVSYFHVSTWMNNRIIMHSAAAQRTPDSWAIRWSRLLDIGPLITQTDGSCLTPHSEVMSRVLDHLYQIS